MTGTATPDDTTYDSTSNQPIMPHRTFSQTELDARYPSIEAIEAVDDEEEEQDPLLLEGERIAQQIVKQVETFGRRRIEQGNST